MHSKPSLVDRDLIRHIINVEVQDIEERCLDLGFSCPDLSCTTLDMTSRHVLLDSAEKDLAEGSVFDHGDFFG